MGAAVRSWLTLTLIFMPARAFSVPWRRSCSRMSPRILTRTATAEPAAKAGTSLSADFTTSTGWKTPTPTALHGSNENPSLSHTVAVVLHPSITFELIALAVALALLGGLLAVHTEERHQDRHAGGRVVPAVHDLNLDIDDGEWLAIQGRTGSGNTTALQLLGGLDRPVAGS
jgi:ABC-type multidrug transport system fused ATPase/permease subunit